MGGRSLTQEAEFRLERSFDAEARVEELTAFLETVHEAEVTRLKEQIALLKSQLHEARERDYGGYKELVEEIKAFKKALERRGFLDDKDID